MKYIEPDFYKDFKCIADKCRHSCCLGWEIDIDEKSFKNYMQLPGELGSDLKKNISTEGEPHFILSEDERCPFLRPDGLCRLIAEKGEDILCDICTEHPRFYNFYEGREERGLGLCCEEAVRLLLSEDKPLQFVSYREDSDLSEDEPEIIFRDNLLALIAERSEPITELFERILLRLNCRLTEFNYSYWARLFLSFEQMNESWTELLKRSLGKSPLIGESLNFPYYERLISYFIYRHFVNLSYDYGIAESLMFCILSVAFIAALDKIYGPDPEHIRLYSSEIEYSVENIDFIMEKISKSQN